MNHASPQGMYTHDRERYYDLHLRDRDSKPSVIGRATPEPFESNPKILFGYQKIRWFNQHYVHPAAWKVVADNYPKLKVCLAHFCDQNFMGKSGSSGSDNPIYGELKTGFHTKGGQIDHDKTNEWISALVDLISEKNRVFADLSFFILNDDNIENFSRLIHWAKRFKPILLERILYGSDWPYVSNQGMLHNILHSKSNVFDDFGKSQNHFLSSIDPELWIRLTFLNPCQYLGLKAVLPNVSKGLGIPPPTWGKELPDPPMEFNGDKMKDFLKQRKTSFKHA